MLVNAAALDSLPQSVLVGTDVLGLLEMLQARSGTEVEKAEPLEKALVVMTRSHIWRKPTEETTEPGIVSILKSLILVMSFSLRVNCLILS